MNYCTFIDLNFKKCKKECQGKLCEKHERITIGKKLIMEIIDEKIKTKDIDIIVYNF